MAAVTPQRATIDDLLKTEGKAELIGGRIVPLMPTGRKPNRAAGRIYSSLDAHAEATGRGEAYTDNMGFAIPELPSRRESFSPDASYYDGPFPADPMQFITGPPTFAVEVRGKTDSGPAAERSMAAKRSDYFAAGTLVVWDVDPVAGLIHVHRAADPSTPTTYSRGQTAEAEPAVPGWTIAVERVLGPE